MNQNTLIWLLVGVIVIGGGIWIFSGTGPGSNTASTTPTVTTSQQTGSTNTSATAPVVTTGTLVIPSTSTALLTGKVFPGGAQTSYWYEFGTTQSLGLSTTKQSVGSGFENITAPAYLTGLSANTVYYFRLVAQNSLGTTNGTTLSFTTNSTPPPTGSAPAAHTDSATAVTRTSASLSGRVTPNGADTSFWFEYGESAALGNTTAFVSAGSGTAAQTESVSVSGLKPLTKYYFRINSQNQFGTTNGAILSFTTSGPAAIGSPGAVTGNATVVTQSSATLRGSVNPSSDPVTSYWFVYGTDAQISANVVTTTHHAITVGGTANVNVSADITGLASGTTYWYRLVVMNTFGTTNGAVAAFTTK